MPAKKIVASKVAKTLAPVKVEMKKIETAECCDSSKECCMPAKHKCCGKFIKLGLLLLNTILLIVVIVNQNHIEEMKVGGGDNYKLLKTLFTSEGFKNYQKAQIEQTMQMLKNAPTGQTQQAPTGTGQAQQVQVQQPQVQ